jgi:hypothetical protein
MSLHAFERRCVFDARLGRLVEPLIADCDFTREGTITFILTVPTTSSKEGFGLVHASKICPRSPQFMQESVFVSFGTRPRIIFA